MGQTTVEYILLLTVVISLVLLVTPLLRRILQERGDFSERLIDRVFSPENLHRYPPGRGR